MWEMTSVTSWQVELRVCKLLLQVTDIWVMGLLSVLGELMQK